MGRLTVLTVALAVVLGALGFGPTAAQAFVGTTPAAEFPAGLEWVNAARPLTLAELRGKVVLLDFWTYGCINCVHVIPELQALEAKYHDELVVIGVHSAKFLNEAETVNIELVAERYERREPIVNDAAFEVWRAYGVRAWPTLVLIDPAGNVVGRHEGEGAFAPLDAAIAGTIAAFDARGELDRSPRDLTDGGGAPRTVLRFPEGVLADAAVGRLFIADSGNDRIVVTDLGGVVLEVIGSGSAGLVDGAFEAAAFDWPHGMALASPRLLYVADTGNHAIRLVDLAERTVTTVAGTGEQGYMFGRSVASAEDGINSPWDLAWSDGRLFVAMAGQHQVWRLDPTAGTLHLVAGSGREELRDGAALTAGLNQPTGLTTDGAALFVADSEASAVRRVDLEPGGQVTTLVGTGLFDFGDVDGVGDEVRLQHVQDVDLADGYLYLADSYNHKVKRLDPVTREVVTVLGTGAPGWEDGAAARFHEPGSVSVAGRLLYVADTDNHVIRVADLGTGLVRTLDLADPAGRLTPGLNVDKAGGATALPDEVVELPAVVVAPGAGSVALTLTLPAGYQANDLAPLQVSVSSDGPAARLTGPVSRTVPGPHYPLTLEFPVQFSAGGASVLIDVVVYYCRQVAAELCLVRQARLVSPLKVVASANDAESNRGVRVSWQPPALPRE